LAGLLLSKGYEVAGTSRQSQSTNLERVEHILDQITLQRSDLQDRSALVDLLRKYKPDEIYNLAGTTLIPASWDYPLVDVAANAESFVNLLEAVRIACPQSRIYQASTSELFGNATEAPQNEQTPFHPRNPYGAAKLFAHWITVNYRERYGLYAVSGILYNHESPRRGVEFVTRKVSQGAAEIKHGLSDKLHLGNLDAQRDWGYAGDYVQAMWRMLQKDEPEDYVIATGRLHSVRELCEIAFREVGRDYREFVVEDPRYYRPSETIPLVGDASKAKEMLDWSSTVSFEQLIKMMVQTDLDQLAA
jgi:GDPmannose 4,6-dehydratase